MRTLFLFFVSSILSFGHLSAQSEINQKDANGERHGVWKKKFETTNQLRYEGQFDHGKETGFFAFYCEACGENPTATKEFIGNDIADVTYFTIKGKIVSEGQMQGRLRIGEWLYYHKESAKVMSREHYVAGKLEGVKTTYYTSEVVAETLTYTNGLMEGPNNHYSLDGLILKELNYKNDTLHGPATYYDSQAVKLLEGQYKAGRKEGVWKTYVEAKLTKEERFPKPLLKGK